MKLEKFTLNVGADKPFCAYHMSDNHVCLADGRDNERKNELARNRERDFCGAREKTTPQTAEELFSVIKKENALLIHTGDLIDFVSHKNLEFAKTCFIGVDCIACAGNHEFSLYVGEAWEDEAYKAQSVEAVKAHYPDGILFGVREINGVRFITLDNSYYYILPEIYKKTEEALACGKPSVLVVHTPFYSADTYKKVTAGKADDPPYLCGCPEALLKNLSEHRYKQQFADETTLRFIELINSAPNLKAVLAGHLHEPLVSQLDSGIPQLAACGAFRDVMNYIEFI